MVFEGLALLVPVVAFAVAWSLTRGCCRPGSLLYFLDQPNERSMHTTPVPRTGGVGVMAGVAAAGLLVWLAAGLDRELLAALGGALGAIAVCTKHEIVLAIVGGLFVVEALSVILQVLYYKRTKKRIFLMAPIHHHFEKKGWAEPQIVIRFWIISLILAVVGLATLKVR